MGHAFLSFPIGKSTVAGMGGFGDQGHTVSAMFFQFLVACVPPLLDVMGRDLTL